MARIILIVDDDQLVRETLAELLEAEYRVTSVASVEEGLEVLQEGGVDLLISDGNIPPYGSNAWRPLGEKAKERGIPFIVFSGEILEDEDEEAPLAKAVREAGGIPLAKPGGLKTLIGVVEQALAGG